MNLLLEFENPQLAKERLQFLQEAIPLLSIENQQDGNVLEPLLSVSVVVHVIHNGEPTGQGANLSDEQIRAQIEVLNEDFASLNARFFNTPSQWMGAAGVPNIQFCLATKDPAGNASIGITRHQMQVTGSSWSNNNINSTIKPATKWDPFRYMNIYVLGIPGTTAAGGVVGFSNYPTPSLIGAATDGIVVDYNWFGGEGYPASGVRTLTHETGHYLGLPHTFDGNTCPGDDGISDTPNIEKSTREYMTLDCTNSFPTGPASCGNAHMYVNYMDYVTETCYTSFTNGQVNVMRAVLNGTSSGYGYGSRAQLITSAPNQCSLMANDAGITRLLSPGALVCPNSPFSPQVTLRNFGVTDLTSVQIIWKMTPAAGGGSTFDTLSWQGNLFPGGNLDVFLPDLLPPDGFYDLTFFTANPNGVVDQRLSNDTLRAKNLRAYVAVAPPVAEDFEGETGLPTEQGLFSYNVSGDEFEWELTSDASSFGQGTKAAVFDNFSGTASNNPLGTLDALITRHLDLSEATHATLFFDVAYAPFDPFLDDTLIVMTAVNCSQSFNQVIFKKGGETLATAPFTTSLFTPAASEWRRETIDLSAYAGMPDVTLAFLNQSGWGNRLFLDNLKIGVACSTLANSDMSVTDQSFFQENNGSATVMVSGGNAPVSFAWSNGASGNSISNLSPGIYSVTLTDAFGCSIVLADTVKALNCGNFNVSTPVVHVTCHGESNGSVLAIPISGASPYSYSWSNGAASQLNSGLPAGTYSVTVTGANGCPAIKTAQVNQPLEITLISGATHETAVGLNDGTASVSASGGNPGFTYNWNNGAVSPVISGLAPGNYTVTVSDANGCTAFSQVTVNSFSCNGFQAIITSNDVTCYSQNNGSATVGVTGSQPPESFNWSNNQSSQTISNLPPGIYSITVTDAAGCSAVLTTTISEPSQLLAAASATGETSAGATNGTASATGSGGFLIPGEHYSFHWSDGQTGQDINTLTPGTYIVTVTDANFCTATAIATVEAFPCSLAVSATIVPASCPNLPDGTAIASAFGGSGVVNFAWSNGTNTATAGNLLPGIYSVTATDGAGCTAIGIAEVEGIDLTPPIPELDTFSAKLNASGLVSLPAEALLGSSFDNCSEISVEPDFFQFDCDDLGENIVFLTLTDASGNSTTASTLVNIADDSVPTISCPGNLNVETCKEIEYSMPVGNDNCLTTLSILTGYPSGSNFPQGITEITWQASDPSGNVAICTFLVSVSYDLAVTYEVAEPTCHGVDNGAINLLITGGEEPYEGIWSHGTGPIFLSAGTYTVTVTDANECSLAETIEVGEPAPLLVEILGTSPSTNGQATGAIQLIVSGGISPYAFAAWFNGNLISDFDTQHVLPGAYKLQVTDANGCMVTTEEIIIENMVGASEEVKEAQLLLYPNPSKGKIILKLYTPLVDQAEVLVFDAPGRGLLLEKQVENGGMIDLEQFGAGVYWLKIRVGEKIFWRRVAVF